MRIRLHELHPSLVHFPLVLLPASLLLDALGCALDRRSLRRAGARLMPVAAASAAATAAAGLAAERAVQVPPAARPVLTTHRNLNLALVGLAAALAVVRSRRERPGVGYLAAGLAGVAAMGYTAWLGGHMVYRHGVGVEPAGGVRSPPSPEVRWESVRDVLGGATEAGAGAVPRAGGSADERQVTVSHGAN